MESVSVTTTDPGNTVVFMVVGHKSTPHFMSETGIKLHKSEVVYTVFPSGDGPSTAVAYRRDRHEFDASTLPSVATSCADTVNVIGIFGLLTNVPRSGSLHTIAAAPACDVPGPCGTLTSAMVCEQMVVFVVAVVVAVAESACMKPIKADGDDDDRGEPGVGTAAVAVVLPTTCHFNVAPAIAVCPKLEMWNEVDKVC